MYEKTHAQVKRDMDKWLVGEIPASVKQGVESTKIQLSQVVMRLTGDSDVKVDVWQSWDDYRLLRFEYIYMDGPKAVFGWYLLNTRFWDTHDNLIPASMDSDEVSPS